MTLDMLFLILVPAYLVLVAYGQIGSRRRRLGGRARLAAGALRVAVPPLVLVAALAIEEQPALLQAWLPVVIGMGLAGAVVAILAEVVAPRVGT